MPDMLAFWIKDGEKLKNIINILRKTKSHSLLHWILLNYERLGNAPPVLFHFVFHVMIITVFLVLVTSKLWYKIYEFPWIVSLGFTSSKFEKKIIWHDFELLQPYKLESTRKKVVIVEIKQKVMEGTNFSVYKLILSRNKSRKMRINISSTIAKNKN